MTRPAFVLQLVIAMVAAGFASCPSPSPAPAFAALESSAT
jgi:hypothetical protein